MNQSANEGNSLSVNWDDSPGAAAGYYGRSLYIWADYPLKIETSAVPSESYSFVRTLIRPCLLIIRMIDYSQNWVEVERERRDELESEQKRLKMDFKMITTEMELSERKETVRFCRAKVEENGRNFPKFSLEDLPKLQKCQRLSNS